MPYFHQGCYIERGRNISTHLFFKETPCTDLIFVDSDLSFDSDAMLKLLKHDKDIVAGIYPYKTENLNFPLNVYYDDAKNCLDKESGLIRLNIAPTGLMRIQRRVFEKMIDNGIRKTSDGIYCFFDTGFTMPGEDLWYGEDVTFCKRWTGMGGEIYGEPDIDFCHIGNKKYSGNFLKYMTERKTVFTMRPPELSLEPLIKELPFTDGLMAEIGCYTGESTEQFAMSNKFLGIYAIDSWEHDVSEPAAYLSDMDKVEAMFDKRISRYGCISKIKKPSMEAVKEFPDKYFDFVYIDGNHAYDYVKNDIQSWMPKIKDNGIIAGHDYAVYEGVRKAVDEIFGKPDKTYSDYSWAVFK